MESELIESAEEFVRLRSSSDPDEYLRAATESAPIAVWLEVIDRYPKYRFWVAQNKTVPDEILSTLARDEDPKVRHMTAMKNSLSQDLFEILSSDPDPAVRARIAYNKNVPQAILARLLQDPEELVSSAAAAKTPPQNSPRR